MQDRSADDKVTKLAGTYYYRADIPEACKRPHGHELLCTTLEKKGEQVDAADLGVDTRASWPSHYIAVRTLAKGYAADRLHWVHGGCV